MCLDKLCKKSELCKNARNHIGSKMGWKVFEIDKNNNKLNNVHFFKNIYKINKWYKNNPITLNCYYNNDTYISGFHIYLNYNDAIRMRDRLYYYRRFIIKKVKYKNIICLGLQEDMPIVVAESMLINYGY